MLENVMASGYVMNEESRALKGGDESLGRMAGRFPFTSAQ
jgi:hypothetical protein